MLNETSEFPFWGLIICVDFDSRDLIKMVRYKGLDKIIFQNKNIDIYKTTNPFVKPGFQNWFS